MLFYLEVPSKPGVGSQINVSFSITVYGSQGCLLLILELQRWAIQALQGVRHRLLLAITNLVFYVSE